MDGFKKLIDFVSLRKWSDEARAASLEARRERGSSDADRSVRERDEAKGLMAKRSVDPPFDPSGINSMQRMPSLSKEHAVYTTNRQADSFAKEYVKGNKGSHAGHTAEREKDSEKFHTKYDVRRERSGFAGSGRDVYVNKETGASFRVARMANGKGFYGTDHVIERFK